MIIRLVPAGHCPVEPIESPVQPPAVHTVKLSSHSLQQLTMVVPPNFLRIQFIHLPQSQPLCWTVANYLEPLQGTVWALETNGD